MSGHELLLHIAGGVPLLLWSARMVRTGLLRAFGAELAQRVPEVALEYADERLSTATAAGAN